MGNDLLNKTRLMVRQNSPAILTGFAVAGTLSTAYYAAKGSFKASRVIEQERLEEAPLKDVVKAVWPCYIPAAVTGTVTVGCIVSAHSMHGRRAAAAVSAYTITEQAFSEYRAKVQDELGSHKEQVLRDDLARDRVANNPAAPSAIIAGDGNVMCCELYTGRYFMSSMENLRQAMNTTNASVVTDYYVTLDTFYDLVGLKSTSESSELGWDSDRLMDLEFSTVLTDEGKPCLAFNYNYIKPI